MEDADEETGLCIGCDDVDPNELFSGFGPVMGYDDDDIDVDDDDEMELAPTSDGRQRALRLHTGAYLVDRLVVEEAVLSPRVVARRTYPSSDVGHDEARTRDPATGVPVVIEWANRLVVTYSKSPFMAALAAHLQRAHIDCHMQDDAVIHQTRNEALIRSWCGECPGFTADAAAAASANADWLVLPLWAWGVVAKE
jgi:hypothetical protein